MCLNRTGIRRDIPENYSEICIKVFIKSGKYLRPASYRNKKLFRKIEHPTYLDTNIVWISSGLVNNEGVFYKSGFHAFRYGTDISTYNLTDPDTVTRVVVLSDITAIGYQDHWRHEQVVVGRTMYIVPKKDEAVFLRLAQSQKTIRPKVYRKCD